MRSHAPEKFVSGRVSGATIGDDMNIRTTLFTVLIPLLWVTGGTTAAQAPPHFEVASVKANISGDGKDLIQAQPGGRFTATNVTLRQLIRAAYQLQESQIAGGPSWLGRDRFDIVAKADSAEPGDPFQAVKGGSPSRGQLMLRALLAERFTLEIHTEARELALYALVQARSDGTVGPQLKRSAPDCDASDAHDRPECAMRTLPGIIAAGGATLTELANSLSTMVNRPVLDRTGLGDRFAFTLRWTPDQLSPGLERKARAMGLPPIDPDGPALFTAVREQLGLKLDSQKGPVEILVVDRVERPKEN